MTPAEHLRLPNVEDVKEGIIASRIAAHAADIAKGIPSAMDWDNEMSLARKNLDWEKMFSLAIDPEKARRVPGRGKAGEGRYMFHVREFLRGKEYEPDPGRRDRKYF